MSVRISLDNPPEFYTNLDVVSGRIILSLNRVEQVSAIVVKLEGESRTALSIPNAPPPNNYPSTTAGPGDILNESHKILYKIQQVFPPRNAANAVVHPGQHEFPFRFKMPINNICGNPEEMVKLGGLAGVGGFASGPGLLGFGGVRVMDGSKQLMYQHVVRTLPPSFTGFPREAEIRYYIKVTIQRPGLFKENWRFQLGLKFLPIDPPRPKNSGQEAFARRPFTFQPRTPGPQLKQKGRSKAKDQPNGNEDKIPPSVEISARLPHPPILTCNKPVPLRLVAKKLVASPEQVYLTNFQMDLIGFTKVRCYDLTNTETSRWVVCSKSGLTIPVGDPDDVVNTETILSDSIWKNIPLPNTVTPSFIACNLQRTYSLELKLGLTWGSPAGGKNALQPVSIFLPLHFSKVEVYSGIKPPAALVDALSQRPPRAPRPPPRPSAPQQPIDPLFPPQLGTPAAQIYDDAPPSYDEAMAESMTGPMFANGERPAYSGQTNENAPSLIPEKGSQS